MGDLYLWSLQDHGSIALFQPEGGGPEQPTGYMGYWRDTGLHPAPQLPPKTCTAAGDGPVAAVSQLESTLQVPYQAPHSLSCGRFRLCASPASAEELMELLLRTLFRMSFHVFLYWCRSKEYTKGSETALL